MNMEPGGGTMAPAAPRGPAPPPLKGRGGRPGPRQRGPGPRPVAAAVPERAVLQLKGCAGERPAEQLLASSQITLLLLRGSTAPASLPERRQPPRRPDPPGCFGEGSAWREPPPRGLRAAAGGQKPSE